MPNCTRYRCKHILHISHAVMILCTYQVARGGIYEIPDRLGGKCGETCKL